MSIEPATTHRSGFELTTDKWAKSPDPFEPLSKGRGGSRQTRYLPPGIVLRTSGRPTSSPIAIPPIPPGRLGLGIDRPNETGDTPAGEGSVEMARREPVVVVSEAPPWRRAALDGPRPSGTRGAVPPSGRTGDWATPRGAGET